MVCEYFGDNMFLPDRVRLGKYRTKTIVLSKDHTMDLMFKKPRRFLTRHARGSLLHDVMMV